MTKLQKAGIAQKISHVAGYIKSRCPDIFSQRSDSPIVRMTKYTEDKITYEITKGADERDKPDPV